MKVCLIIQQNVTQIGIGVDTSEVSKKYETAGSKSDVDKLDIDKLKQVPNDSSKLSDTVDNTVAKKNVCDKKSYKR